MNKDIAKSFDRVSLSGDAFIGAFHKRFLASDERALQALGNVDIAKQNQMMINSIVYFVIKSDVSDLEFDRLLSNLIVKHRDEFTNDLRGKWEEALTVFINKFTDS